MNPGPPHPALIPRIPMRYTAEISTHHGWWFRYTVHRLHGIFIPEKSVTHHRTFSGARRSARRWTRRNDQPATQSVESYR